MIDVVVLGQALNDFGFEALGTIQGLGLNTRGFLWPCDGIWAPSSGDNCPLTTTWTQVPNSVTNVEGCIDVGN